MAGKRHLLIVDDEKDLRETLIEQLGLTEEFMLSAAETATQALAVTKGDRIDLVVMDVGLPDMDGREAV